MFSKQQELAELRQKQRKASKGKINQDSRDRLKHIADKKFRTCFIFALSQFEDMFGLRVWGHNLSDDQITPEQKRNRSVWNQVRKNILDKGNAQSRALSMEIGLHNVEFEGYRMNFEGVDDERSGK